MNMYMLFSFNSCHQFFLHIEHRDLTGEVLVTLSFNHTAATCVVLGLNSVHGNTKGVLRASLLSLK